MTPRRFRPPLHVWAGLLLCAAVFIIRGPMRAADPAVNMDTPLLLTAAATWRDGGNPYDPASIAATFGDRASAIAPTLLRGQQAFVYPPPFYSLLSPLTYLPWAVQRRAWNLLNTAMFLASLLLICRLAGVPVRSASGFAIIGLGLSTNPGQICVALGQTGITALFLMSLSWSLRPAKGGAVSRGRALLAAVAAALAAVAKPQIAAIYLCFDLLNGRRRVAIGAGAMAVAAVFAAIGIHGGGISIWRAWMQNMRALMHADADPLHGSLPHQLINLQSPLTVLFGSRAWVSAMAIAACGLLGAAYAWIDRQPQRSSDPAPADWLNSLSAETILMLLIFYHRIYDAVFLVVPAAFAVRQIAAGSRQGWALLSVLLPLWIPLASAAYRMLEPSGSFAVGVLPQAFLIQHQTWFLLGAFALLFSARSRLVSSRIKQNRTDVSSS